MHYNTTLSNLELDVWHHHISIHLEERDYRNLRQSCKNFRSQAFTTAIPKHQEWTNAMANRAIAHIFLSNQHLINEAFESGKRASILSIIGAFGIAFIGSFLRQYPSIHSIIGDLSLRMLFGKMAAYNDLTEELRNSVTSFEFHVKKNVLSFELEAAAIRNAIQLFPRLQTISLKGRTDDNLITSICKQKAKKLFINPDKLYDPAVTGATFKKLPDSIEEFICHNGKLDNNAMTDLAQLKNLKIVDVRGSSVKEVPECLKNRHIIVEI